MGRHLVGVEGLLVCCDPVAGELFPLPSYQTKGLLHYDWFVNRVKESQGDRIEWILPCDIDSLSVCRILRVAGTLVPLPRRDTKRGQCHVLARGIVVPPCREYLKLFLVSRHPCPFRGAEASHLP